MKISKRQPGALAVSLLLLLGTPVRANDTYGPIRRGDNLWDIARQVYPDQGVTRSQIMVGLLKANPQAFAVPCNASSTLRTGALLRVPPLSEIRAIGPAEANQEFQDQVREWKEHLRTGRPLVCPPVSKHPPPAVSAPQPQPKPKAAAAPAHPAPPPSAPAPAGAKAGAAPPQPPIKAPAPTPEGQGLGGQPTAAPRTRPEEQPSARAPAAPQRTVPPATQPRVKAAPSLAADWSRFWRQIEHDLAEHERLSWLVLLLALGLAVAIGLHSYSRRKGKTAQPPEAEQPETIEAFADLSPAEAAQRLQSDTIRGLTTGEAQRRLEAAGRNALPEKQVTLLERGLPFFWGPIPWMIEVAAVLSALLRHWADLAIILALLLFNAAIGFWQDFKAANALDALKRQLALKARVLRDSRWGDIDADQLVPGDVIRLRLGDIIPADAKLIDGGYLAVDQSALTGESLPVDKQVGEIAYSGSVAKQGEMVALVTATGGETFFGRTAKLVEAAGAVSHFQKAVLAIGDYLIYLSVALVTILIIAQLFRHAPLLDLVQFALILTVASIPVAMPAVLSVTMAVGALALSKMKAIVSRLQSIEEMAGIDILCSDKTGTLTQNRLTLGEPEVFAAVDAQDLILAAALASKAEDRDAIDLAVIGGLRDAKVLGAYSQTGFVPFDPVRKRTEATITGANGNTFKVTKGAPQVVLELAHVNAAHAKRADGLIQALAEKGFRTLGVARTDTAGTWHFLGILPLFDPPREDSRETIRQAGEHGIRVKMVTGDNTAIAREVAERLGLGAGIQPAGDLLAEAASRGHLSSDVAERIEAADGFAQVFPEHKYAIVKALQERGHLVAMTGDGVNDAPALKQADVGIAVSGATDAARAAAALVLTAPGLSTIVSAVEEARRIFERMNSYAIYRIVETIRIMVFVVLAMIAFNFYPITAIMIILLAFFNDVPIMAIAYDNTWLDPKPVRWQMHRVLTVATVLGLIGVVETFGLLWIAREWMQLSLNEIQTFIFLKLAVAGHLTLFVARTHRPFWSRPFPSPLLLWSAIVTKVLATLFVIFPFGLITPIRWIDVALIWIYCIVWIFIEDWAKLAVYNRFHQTSHRHRSFLNTVGRRMHIHASP
jgi:H+-transporting ATPase